MALLILARCCLTASSPVLSKPPQQTDSEGSWQISAQESGTNTLRLSVFEWRGWCGAGWVIICAHTPWGICLMVLIGSVMVLIGREEVGWYTGSGGQGQKDLQAQPLLRLPLLGLPHREGFLSGM